MEYRLITNNEFFSLAALNSLMYQEINQEINEFQSINTLIHFINSGGKSFVAIGAYNDNELVGFTHGKALLNNKFEFLGIYLLPSFRSNTKNLIDFSFDFIEKSGYTGWEVDATNPNISSIMEKYGATIRYTRYTKEFK